MSTMFSIENLVVNKNGNPICTLDSASASVSEVIGITGANGSGKSTLLRVLAGIETGFTGNISFQQHDVQIGYLHQRPYLFRGTVFANVTYGIKDRTIDSPEMQRADWLMSELGISDLRDRICDSLSGGEARRVALARTLVVNPTLILLDEPFSDLDSVGIDAVCKTLATITTATIVVVQPNSFPAELQLDQLIKL